jgi:3-deoxy-D-manno-octulosonic-acid transferase
LKPLLTLILWFIYFPILFILSYLLSWHPKIRERIKFEKKNKFEWLAHSFSEVNEKADLCFEFSSEGEFQQVAPLIEDALSFGKKIELVFFSPSVEKTIMKLAAQFPDQIRYLRYPFLRFFPFLQRRCFSKWVTSNKLILVRYDLFPEFLLWSMKDTHHLSMVWVTFKKERSQSRGPSLWKKLFLKYSDRITYAGVPDLETGKLLGLPGEVFDFRIEQIRRRVSKRKEKFYSHFPIYDEFKSTLLKSKKTVIMGNAWPSDLFLLTLIPKDVLVVIVPHKLSENILTQFRKGLEALGRDSFEINDLTQTIPLSTSMLLNKRGILCELYADFDYSYVGGGFEGSIHSVLEPLVAGPSRIACGPSHHRSTEYDVASASHAITEVNTPEQFLLWLNQVEIGAERDTINSLVQDYSKLREFVFPC